MVPRYHGIPVLYEPAINTLQTTGVMAVTLFVSVSKHQGFFQCSWVSGDIKERRALQLSTTHPLLTADLCYTTKCAGITRKPFVDMKQNQLYFGYIPAPSSSVINVTTLSEVWAPPVRSPVGYNSAEIT